MKIAGQECSVEEAYAKLSANESLVDQLESTADERHRLITYATLRSHRDYLLDLEAARRNY